MAGKFTDLLGTVYNKFRIGLGGPNIKNNAGVVEARDPADAAYAAVAALLFSTYGDDFELNSGATQTGNDWTLSFRRPSTGMTEDVVLVWPNTAPTTGQALTVASYAGGVITFTYTTVAAGTDKIVTDATALTFDSAASLAMFNLPANAVVLKVRVIVDTPFDGTAPTVSIGISGTLSKYMTTTQSDLKASAATSFEVTPNIIAAGGIEAIIATYAASSATVGAARMQVDYVIPS